MLTLSTVSHYPKIGDTAEEQLLRRSLAQFDRKEINRDQLERVKDEVTRIVIQEQIDAGIEIITDGQIRWDDPVTYLASKIQGFTLKGLLRYFDTNTFYRQPICEGELALPESLVVKDFQFANAISSVPTKALLTGPFTLAKLCKDKFYGSLEAFGLKLAAILGEETQRLVQTGATIVQFDEPALLNFRKEFPLFKKIWAKLASFFPKELETLLFLNFGDLRGIYPQILELPVRTIGLDLSAESQNWKVLSQAPFTKKLVAGVVDARNTKMETEEEIQGSLEKLLNLVSPENLSISPNFGLEFLPREAARRKLANLSKIVREFRSAKVKV